MSTAAQQSKPSQGVYDVARPHGRCHVSGNPIEPDTRFMAALRETPTGFERLDVSLGAWDQFDRSGVLAHWQTVMPHPEQKKKLFVDDQVLCELFERLAAATEPPKINFRFVLGLILMRKRMIIYETSRIEDDREIWSVRFKGRAPDAPLLEMINPKLNEQQVQDVSQQLGEILNEEL